MKAEGNPPPVEADFASARESGVPRRRNTPRYVVFLLLGLGLYLTLSYLLLPELWHRYEGRHPALADAETLTHTASGIPADPINIGLVGSEEEFHRAMLAAKWYPADAITLESALRIAVDVVLRRPYDDAPVSSLYLWGRKEDFAFEQPMGNNPRQRHHVRFWRSAKLDAQSRPLWLGAATMDVRVGLSSITGQITHHISPDVDLERDRIIADLKQIDGLSRVYWIDGFHKALNGINGEGDPWRTDGRLAVGEIKSHDRTP